MNYHDTINISLDFQRNDMTPTCYTRNVHFSQPLKRKLSTKTTDIYGTCGLEIEFRGHVEQTAVLIAQLSSELWPIEHWLSI